MGNAEEAWEQPKAKGWRTKKEQPISTHSRDSSAAVKGNNPQNSRPTRIAEGLTVEKLLQDFTQWERKWTETDCAKYVERFLRNRRLNISTAVCIGIGSFSIDWEHRYRSLWQLVLFMAVVKGLRRRTDEIRLYAQEPAFNTLDIAFLKALDITVLTANIETHISQSTFVFAPFVDWYLLLPVFLRNKNPELYLGNQILEDYRQYADNAEKQNSLAECKQVGKVFIQGRTRMRLPDFELHGNALNGIMLYWKEEEEDDG